MKKEKMKVYSRFAYLLFAMVLVSTCLPIARAAESSKTTEATEASKVRALEKETKAKLAEKRVDVEEAVEVVEKAIEEKELIAEEAKIIEREAVLVKKEADLLTEEAESTDSSELKKKAEAAQKEAEKLMAESEAAKEKLLLAESKAKLAHEKITQDEKHISLLKKELADLKLESVGLGGVTRWMNRPLFYIGDSPVTFGGMGSAMLILLVALFISAIIQRVLIHKLTKASALRSGVAYAIGRMVHYLIVILAAILAAQCVGLNLGSLAVIFGFLSVGIGFGLQNITSNFISGIILLFERPIGVGDFVTVDGQVGTVRHISMRSSLIETLDNVRIIVPNSKFIEGNVTNWSHGSTRVRLHCPVGVAYGSDIEKVKEALLKVGVEHKDVRKSPEPAVRFLGFGNSSLDFDLLVWIDDPEGQYRIHSDINYRIDAIFREYGVTIPFPQRDLHIKSSDVQFNARE